MCSGRRNSEGCWPEARQDRTVRRGATSIPSSTPLVTIDPLLRRVATALGLTHFEQLRHIYVPLALPHMLSGIRIAAVVSIGTATLAAFIGAGGLGEPIVSGVQAVDTTIILSGAIPAALLAILVDVGLGALERRLRPRGVG